MKFGINTLVNVTVELTESNIGKLLFSNLNLDILNICPDIENGLDHILIVPVELKFFIISH